MMVRKRVDPERLFLELPIFQYGRQTLTEFCTKQKVLVPEIQISILLLFPQTINMSSQKGNASRTRPQKHQNRAAFKNNLHDTSNRTKLINSIQVSDVCIRCKEIIEWKIKYKKYKPLTQPKTCVKCGLKAVKKAYHVMCRECGKKLGCCTKCCQKKDIVQAEPSEQENSRLDGELKALLQSLSERKRRTFLRYMNKKDKEGEEPKIMSEEDDRKDLLGKLNALKLGDGDDLDFSDEEEEDESGEDSDVS